MVSSQVNFKLKKWQNIVAGSSHCIVCSRVLCRSCSSQWKMISQHDFALIFIIFPRSFALSTREKKKKWTLLMAPQQQPITAPAIILWSPNMEIGMGNAWGALEVWRLAYLHWFHSCVCCGSAGSYRVMTEDVLLLRQHLWWPLGGWILWLIV